MSASLTLSSTAPTESTRFVPARFHVRGTWPSRIVVAADGTPSANAALRTARVFARRNAAEVSVVTVYAPRIPIPSLAGESIIERCAPSDRSAISGLLRDVRRQIAQTLDDPSSRAGWPLTLEIGDPSAAIVRAAEAFQADLTIVGIGAADPHERRLGMHTAFSASLYAASPIYACAPGCEAPSAAVVPVLDGDLHVPTLRAAIASLLPGGRLWVAAAHAGHAADVAIDTTETMRERVTRVCGEAWRSRVDEIEIRRVEMLGDPVAALLRVAGATNAQLIAIPNFGAPGAVRAFLPNHADALLLAARCAVLVVPDRASDRVAMRLGAH